jgi:hypothetical protein
MISVAIGGLRCARTTGLIGLLAFAVAVPASAFQSQPAVDVVGVSVSLPDPDNEYGQSLVPGRSPGVEVHVRVQDKSKTFIGVVDAEQNAEAVTTLHDGSGNAMAAGSSFGFGNNISEDGHSVTVQVSSSDVPPAGSNSLQVKGTIILQAGADETTEDAALTLATESTVKLGGIEAKVTQADEGVDENSCWLGLEASNSFDTIAEFKFLDAAGKELEGQSMGGGSFGFGDEMTYQKNFSVAAKPGSKITVRIRYFKSTEEIKIPVDMPVALGLGK